MSVATFFHGMDIAYKLSGVANAGKHLLAMPRNWTAQTYNWCARQEANPVDPHA